MSGTLRAWARRLWPRHTFPGLRGRVVAFYRTLRAVKENLRFQVWRRISHTRHGEMRPVTVYGIQEILVRTDDFRGYIVARLQGSQKEKIALWSQAAQWKPGVCIDVGANYGEFSAAVSQLGMPVVAVEANPRLIDCLERSFADRPTVKVIHAAAAEENGHLSFYYNPRSSGSASIAEALPKSEIADYVRAGEVVKVDVAARRLDDMIEEALGSLPDSFILKVDVEGFEELVLAGADRLIAHARWWRGLIEFSPSALKSAGRSPDRLWQMLRRFQGIIVSEDMAHNVTPALDAALPANPPDYECDVLVGAGEPADAAQSGRE